MNKILQILKWEFMVRFRSKIFLISLFMPLLVLGISVVSTMFMQDSGDTKTNIGLVHTDDNFVSELKSYMSESHRLKSNDPQFIFINYRSFDVAMPDLQNKLIDAIIIIPTGILDTASATLYARSLNNILMIENVQAGIAHTVTWQRLTLHGLDREAAKKASQKANLKTFEVDEEGQLTKGNELMMFFGPFFFVFLLVMAVFINGQLLLRSVIEERTNRMVEILLSSVTSRELMSGKILGLSLLGLAQICFYLLMGMAFGIYKGIEIVHLKDLPLLFIYFLAGYFFFASIYATLGTLFDNEQDAQQTMGIVSIIAMVPLIGSFYFLNNPSSLITRLLSFFPPMTPFMMILRINGANVEVWEIIVSIIVMVFSVWGMMILAGKIFRTALLMYGKRITFPEIIRWIKVSDQN